MEGITNKNNYLLTSTQKANRAILRRMSDTVRYDPIRYKLSQIIEPEYIRYALVAGGFVVETVTIENVPNNFKWPWHRR